MSYFKDISKVSGLKNILKYTFECNLNCELALDFYPYIKTMWHTESGVYFQINNMQHFAIELGSKF
jgi:hypothetical protein